MGAQYMHLVLLLAVLQVTVQYNVLCVQVLAVIFYFRGMSDASVNLSLAALKYIICGNRMSDF